MRDAIYRRIWAELRDRMLSGAPGYAPGDMLDAEAALADAYGVNVTTIRRATAMLRADGLITPTRGGNYRINPLPVLTRDAAARFRRREVRGARGAFEAELNDAGLTYAHDPSEVHFAAVPDDVADLLGVPHGTEVLTRSRKMSAMKPGDEESYPVQLAVSWVPADLAGGAVSEIDSGVGGTYSRLAERGHAPARFTETVTVRRSTEPERDFLRTDEEQRVYDIRRVAYDSSKRVVEVTDTVTPVRQYRLLFTWDADQD
jgi:GntR family transcriptional regulator